LINKRGGRPFGATSKTSQVVRWGLVEAYRQLGGVDGLVRWGKEKPDLFYPLLCKLLPHELAEQGYAGNITVIINTKPQHINEKHLPVDMVQDVDV
jgi:hypothetical protein